MVDLLARESGNVVCGLVAEGGCGSGDIRQFNLVEMSGCLNKILESDVVVPRRPPVVGNGMFVGTGFPSSCAGCDEWATSAHETRQYIHTARAAEQARTLGGGERSDADKRHSQQGGIGLGSHGEFAVPMGSISMYSSAWKVVRALSNAVQQYSDTSQQYEFDYIAS